MTLRPLFLIGISLIGAVVMWVAFKPGADEEEPKEEFKGSNTSVMGAPGPEGAKAQAALKGAAMLEANPTEFADYDQKQMQHLLALFKAEVFDGAVLAAERQLSDEAISANYRTWLVAQMPVLLASQGWQLLKSGNCTDAISLFQRATKTAKQLEADKGLAVCYFKLKAFDEAEGLFQNYMLERPQDLEMRLIYSDLLESQGKFPEALSILDGLYKEAVLPEGLERNVLEKRLSSMRAKSRESIKQTAQVTEYYRLTYRSEDHESLIPLVVQTLDTALEEFRGQWGLGLPQSPIEVILYPEGSFRDLVAYSPRWASGIYDGRIRIPVSKDFFDPSRSESFRRILRHEMFHAVIAEQIDRRVLPAWFNEGVAQFLECTGGCPPPGFPPIRGLFLSATEFNQRFTELDIGKAELAYKQSLFLVRTLNFMYTDNALHLVFENMTEKSQIDSDGLLRKFDLSFNTLRDTAAAHWKIGRSY